MSLSKYVLLVYIVITSNSCSKQNKTKGSGNSKQYN